MDFYLIPNDPKHTLLVSANGVPHYQIDTEQGARGNQVTLIQRPGIPSEDNIIAEIEWGESDMPTIIRSSMLGGAKGVVTKALDYLYKRHRFGPTRYFVADDSQEYRWKMIRGVGCVLTRSDSSTEIASSMSMLSTEGLFAGEKKHILRVQPCSVDMDIVILTFVMMEKKRRDRDGIGGDLYFTPHDAEPQGDGGDGDAGDGGLVGEL
ncbi:hypothetical protein D9613_003275 [Agrocybe pediades]|uniref:DUF6593 domain-containing protein n=1 Tax=Agrocybe pediades TaxID=84607 RepID=A0A8H4QP49_9AGAR|nr:hypothetical protein D9613_003275 [Agrocybe pediades]